MTANLAGGLAYVLGEDVQHAVRESMSSFS